ncbi:MAG: superoxide dismutase family protein [Candidatus Omnitrophica bacterium]|nr:superoxide dismutase family protein [Candidatus Omnitrophota bacterium]
MKRNFLLLIFFMTAICVVFAQAQGTHEHEVMISPTKAQAMIKGTSQDSKISGVADFTEKGDGVQVEVHIAGVDTPGKHGFHIHEFGSCSDTGKAAGGHFNPMKVEHGFLPEDGMKSHMGDMGNITIDQTGSGSISLFLSKVTISGENGIAGRAVILHEKEDDFGQPTGNAGGRIGCGVIGYIGVE